MLLARQLASPKGNTGLTRGSNVVNGLTTHSIRICFCGRAVRGSKKIACGGESGRDARHEATLDKPDEARIPRFIGGSVN